MPVKKASKKVKKSNFEKTVIIIGIILTTMVIFGIALYYFMQYQHAQMLMKDPLLASENVQESIVSKVGKLTVLPKYEQPTIASVTDITKLKSQPFFQNAKNGDMVLVYPKAKVAILYDPAGNKIVQIGPITSNNQSVQGASSVSLHATPVPVTVALYNGTTIVGLAKRVQQSLVQKMQSVTFVQDANASKQDYTQTLVIDLTGKQTASAAQLATVLQGTVGTLPAGETAPAKADLLVILGSK